MPRLAISAVRVIEMSTSTRVPRALPSMSSSFTQRLVRINRLDAEGFQHWSWLPGMLFASDRTWWAAEALRPRPHEGLDLGLFADADGGCRSLSAGTLVPVLRAGQVRAVFTDFLGHSILVSHQLPPGAGRLLSVYAHVVAEPEIRVGYHCRTGEVIARIAPSPKADLPAHLHLTTFWLSGVMPPPTSWSWSMMADAATIRLCDPLQFIALEGHDWKSLRQS